MVVKRNTKGLHANAQKKRQKAFEKVEQGIQKLLKNKEPINFNTVAKASEVSKAWLYKEPEIKSRIEFLREKYPSSKKLPTQQKASDSSKNAIIKTLKERIKRVEAENKGLRKQHEAIYGRILYISELEHKLEKLESENAKLKEELRECRRRTTQINFPKTNKPIQFGANNSPEEINGKIKFELKKIGIRLTNTLKKSIKEASEEIVINAIEALREQMNDTVIRNPGGWLKNAIDNEWKPNKAIGNENPINKFTKWYALAKEQGIVKSNKRDENGSIWVQDNTGEWVTFEIFSAKWTLEYLTAKNK